jgi:large subunit ribosomal protein L18
MANQIPRRRREGVTDYRSRKKAVTSQKPLLVVRVSNKNVSSQFVKPSVKGDVVLSSAHSRELLKLGWMGSRKSTPACYLLGVLAGKKALGKGVKEAILYNGVVPFIRGARIAAFLKGVLDAGVVLPVGEGAFPSEDRLSGKTISEYASKLASEDNEAYQRNFSSLLKNKFKPEDYPAQFDKVRAALRGDGK